MGQISIGELVSSSAEAQPLEESEIIVPAKELSFAEIVNAPNGSIEQSDFVKHFCEKKPLLIPSSDSTRFQHLFSWQTINEILALNLLDRKRLRVTRDGRDVPPALYREESEDRDNVISSKLHEFLKQNASVVMNGVQHLSPPLRRLIHQMERALYSKVGVNGYLTFGAGGAFAMHYDAHDVLVLQVYGTKHWFLYEDPEPSPTDIEKLKAAKPAPREVAFETMLKAGQALYVPRGVYHRACVTDTDSVHLTIGMHPPKVTDFIDWVRPKMQDDPLLREDILKLKGADAVSAQERAIKERLCEIINGASMSEFLGKFQKSFKPSNQFRLGPAEEIDDYTMFAPVLRYRDAWRRSVEKKGQEPSAAVERIVDYLIEERTATFGRMKADLSGVLDEDTLKSTLAQLVDDCWIEVVR